MDASSTRKKKKGGRGKGRKSRVAVSGRGDAGLPETATEGEKKGKKRKKRGGKGKEKTGSLFSNSIRLMGEWSLAERFEAWL